MIGTRSCSRSGSMRKWRAGGQQPGPDRRQTFRIRSASYSASPAPTPTSAPAPELMLSTERIYLAGASLVSLVGETVSGTASFLGRTYPLTRGARSIYAFVAAGTDDPIGRQPLKVDFS